MPNRPLDKFQWTRSAQQIFVSLAGGAIAASVVLTRPADWMISTPPLVFIAVGLAFTRVWKTYRDEMETSSLWERIDEPKGGSGGLFDVYDRIFEIPYVFSVVLLPSAVISLQTFAACLLLFYVSYNHYTLLMARELEGRDGKPDAPPDAGRLMVDLFRVILSDAFGGIRRPRADEGPILGFFRLRALYNSVAAVLLVGLIILVLIGPRDLAVQAGIGVIGVLLVLETFVDPYRVRRVEYIRRRESREVPHTFREILDRDDALLDSFWLPLYRRAFPVDERIGEDQLREAINKPGEHLLVGFHEDGPVSLARYDVAPEPDRYAYLMYMAVDERSWSRGHGQAMFREVVRRCREDPASPAFLILEVERPGRSRSSEYGQSAERRIDFYRRQGCLELRGVDYQQQVPGQQKVPMLVLVKPLTGDVSANDVFTGANAVLEKRVARVRELPLTLA